MFVLIKWTLRCLRDGDCGAEVCTCSAEHPVLSFRSSLHVLGAGDSKAGGTIYLKGSLGLAPVNTIIRTQVSALRGSLLKHPLR